MNVDVYLAAYVSAFNFLENEKKILNFYSGHMLSSHNVNDRSL